MADKPDKSRTLTPFSWMAAAAEVLLEKGVDEVKVDRLAKRFGVTRGSFYWHFKSRNDLLDSILTEWTQAHQTFLDMWRSEAEGPPEERLWKIMRLWVLRDEDLYLPQWHAALRSWSKKSTKVLRLYRRQAEEEFKAMVEVFEELGFDTDEAVSRAHITRLFFESEGYYVGATSAPPEERLKNARKLYRLLIQPVDSSAGAKAKATASSAKSTTTGGKKTVSKKSPRKSSAGAKQPRTDRNSSARTANSPRADAQPSGHGAPAESNHRRADPPAEPASPPARESSADRSSARRSDAPSAPPEAAAEN